MSDQRRYGANFWELEDGVTCLLTVHGQFYVELKVGAAAAGLRHVERLLRSFLIPTVAETRRARPQPNVAEALRM